MKELPPHDFSNIYTIRELNPEAVHVFQSIIYRHYDKNGRKLPWRKTHDPYHILVSEIMLQQTQVERVRAKYFLFIARFPHIFKLANASLRDVLEIWQGLGYNRRAKFLHAIARRVIDDFGGEIPNSQEMLLTLPGIGPSTAGALAAFAFGQPTVFIETNIRRVFIHFFHNNRNKVRDKEILPFVEQTLDRLHVRKWYYALMDYGVMLKATGDNPNRRSAQHHQQSRFQDSDRQIRGLIIKMLIQSGPVPRNYIVQTMAHGANRVKKLIESLVKEGFLQEEGNLVKIPDGKTT
jgi:A/G-specific adenine glycosylase